MSAPLFVIVPATDDQPCMLNVADITGAYHSEYRGVTVVNMRDGTFYELTSSPAELLALIQEASRNV